MTEDVIARGAEIARRRRALGISSVKEFSERSTVSRDAITKAEAGHGSLGTCQRLEGWLDREEQLTGTPPTPAQESHDLEPGVVRFKIRGPHTLWEVETEAHVEDIDTVTEAVEKLLRKVDRGD